MESTEHPCCIWSALYLVAYDLPGLWYPDRG
jgi:hypothetical protein